MSGNPPLVGPLDRQQCMDLFERGGYGRVVFTERALPAIVPVNYLMDDGVVIGGGADERLPRALDGDVVAFETDGSDATTGVAWHLCVIGYAHVVADSDHCERLTRSPSAWAPAPGEMLVRITPDEVTGRAFPVSNSPGGGRLPRPGVAGARGCAGH